MAPFFAEMRRLDDRGPTSRRVAVDAEGAMLGPDCVLVRRAAGGYRSLGRGEAAAIQELLFGTGDAPDRLFQICGGIAKALNESQLALAQIAGLRIPVFELDSRQLKELAAAAPLIKANFNPDEPRDEHGRWTGDGGGDSEAAPAVAAIGTVAAAEAGALDLRDAGPRGSRQSGRFRRRLRRPDRVFRGLASADEPQPRQRRHTPEPA